MNVVKNSFLSLVDAAVHLLAKGDDYYYKTDDYKLVKAPFLELKKVADVQEKRLLALEMVVTSQRNRIEYLEQRTSPHALGYD